MTFGICILTIICLLTIIGSGSIVVSLIQGEHTTKQYVPTRPTRPHHNDAKNNIELEQDIAQGTFVNEIDDFFGEDEELELGENISVE